MDANTKSQLILCLGGAFNPIHTRHVMAMVITKQWIEANTDHKVITGKLAVSTDGYVQTKTRKSGDRCIKSHHRIKLCELACQEYSDWLSPYYRSCGSAAECGERTKRDLIKSTGDTNIDIAVIVGADRAVNKSGFAKWHKVSKHITICIGRKGETAEVRDKFSIDKELGKVKNDFYFIPEELDNVSSTFVRQQLKELDGSDKTKVIDKLVFDGFITEKQGQYILENEEDLYFNM